MFNWMFKKIKFNTEYIKVKKIRSNIGCTILQKKAIKGLGLTRINSERVIKNTNDNLGMVYFVRHMLKIEEVN